MNKISNLKLKIKNSQRGDIVMPVLFIIIAFAILMVGGRMVNISYVNPNEKYTTSGTEGDVRKNNLQLRKIKFTLKKPETFDCGDGAVTGVWEPYTLWAIDPPPGTPVGREGAIKAFYQDENPLTLGVGNITMPKSVSDHAVNPSVGDESARDSNNFPYYPALFLSDTTSDPNNRDGDAQNGGTTHKLDEVFGTWIPLNGTFIYGGNNFDLGPGADPWPAESNVKFQGVPSRVHGPNGAEIVWKVDNLGLTNGHSYRAQFILHDGDHGGDISVGCATIQY